jgi:hypothetical protein
MWIDNHYDKAGDVRFLLHRSFLDRKDGYALREYPGRKNRSGEACLYGWLGETNNISAHACGLVQVTRVSANGERALVLRLSLAETAAWLRANGYTELAP